jgi:DnaJ-class molecular chaperone
MAIALALLCVLAQDDLQSKLCRAFESEKVDATLIADAKASPDFGTRYIAALVQIKQSLATGRGHEAAYQKIVTLGGPAGAAEHLRALAASYKAAMYCRECSNGKVVCGRCNGKKRTEVKCLVCEGKGRVGAPGAVDKTAVTMKCRNCDGKQVFRDVRCPGCAGTGAVDCPSCLGSPWHDRACTVKECRNGRVPCPQCKGKGRVEVPCPTCQGRGRVNAPGGVNPGEVTQRCNDCDSRGVLKDKTPCSACDGTGGTRCEGLNEAAVPVSSVFETETCAPCAKCLGLGVRIKPATAPTKILD